MSDAASDRKEAKMFGRIRQFALDVRAEMAKVSWPTRQQVLEMTQLVLLMTGVLAIFLGFWDLLASQLIKWILR